MPSPGELTFSRTNIGPPAQQLSGVADRQRFGVGCDDGGLQLLIQSARPLAQENRQAVGRLLFCRFERRNRGFGGLQPRATALYIEFGATPRLVQELSQLQRLVLGAQILSRHQQTLLGTSKLKVIACNLGSHGDLSILIVGLLGAQIGSSRLD